MIQNSLHHSAHSKQPSRIDLQDEIKSNSQYNDTPVPKLFRFLKRDCEKYKWGCAVELCLNLLGSRIESQEAEILSKKISKCFRGFKNLTLMLCGSTDKVMVALGESIGRNLIFLEKLKVVVFWTNRLTDAGLSDFVKGISHYQTKLRCLKLELGESKGFTDKSIVKFTRHIGQYLVHLEDLSVKFRKITSITDEIGELIAKSFKGNFIKLKTLRLVFENCYHITGQWAALLTQAIGQHLAVNRVSLSFIECRRLSLEYARLLVKNNFCDLQELFLGFNKGEKIQNEGLIELANSLEGNLYNLQKFSLDFSDCSKIADHGVQALSESISANFKQLLQLSLNLRNCKNLSDLGAAKITASIGFLNRLQNFELNLYKCHKVGHQTLFALGNSLKALSHLEKLLLNFGRCRGVEKKGLSALGFNLQQKTLKQLKLNISHCKKVNDSGVEAFVKSIGPNLSHIDINVGLCRKITDRGVKSIAETLGGNTEELFLNFENCLFITDEAIVLLAKRIGDHLDKLQKLDLKFQGVDQLGNASVIACFENINRIATNLKYLALNFSASEKTMDKSLLALTGVFQNDALRLEDLSLIFEFCFDSPLEIAFELLIGLSKQLKKTLQKLQTRIGSYQCLPKNETRILSKRAYEAFAPYAFYMKQFEFQFYQFSLASPYDLLK